MKTYEDIFGTEHDLGPDYELREVKMWRVHCKHCGTQRIGETPQTDKALQAVKNLIDGMPCRNSNCVSNGGTERRRT